MKKQKINDKSCQWHEYVVNRSQLNETHVTYFLYDFLSNLPAGAFIVQHMLKLLIQSPFWDIFFVFAKSKQIRNTFNINSVVKGFEADKSHFSDKIHKVRKKA